ncbi:MAG: glycine--tRNA ligase subunit beta [Deltaproteobacteria bacterium]|nr:glycine--tRNA ligase subunit beta [Deltaproteobacteria bacterium]
MAKDLILELGSEELPARFINPSLAALKTGLEKALKEHNIAFASLETYGTPRRLAAIIKGLEEKQADSVLEARGPSKQAAFDKDGNPTNALIGFAKSHNVKPADVKTIKTEKGEYVCISKKIKGKKTSEILPALLKNAVEKLTFPKSMHWGSFDVTYGRPLHWILAMYGTSKVEFDYGHIKSSNTTCGHRFKSPAKIKITSASAYLKSLKKAFVLADIEERKAIIHKNLKIEAEKSGGEVLYDDGLMEEVANLVEYPTVVKGCFEKEFLTLPRQVVINAMREHQRYFCVISKKGELLPYFLTVSNTPVKKVKTVSSGNERVLRARLNDAKFYYEKDLKTPLASRVDALKGVVFQAKLGTSYEKVVRFTRLAVAIGETVGFSAHANGDEPLHFLNNSSVKSGIAEGMLDVTTIGDSKEYNKYVLGRASMLAKADLVSGMVGEFPSLQGLMGMEYALKDNEPEEVATAIFEHYLPTTSGGALPTTKAGAIVSIADKLDTICGCFGVGLIPTGAADPYALRRFSIGIMAIIQDKGLHLPLDWAIDRSLDILGDKLKRKKNEATSDILEFFRERLKNQLTSQGLGADTVEAVFSAGWAEINDAVARVKALEEFKGHEAFGRLVVAFKRVSNILKGFDAEDTSVDTKLFKEKDESSLLGAIKAASPEVEKYRSAADYSRVFTSLASIKEAVDSFFDNVMVMTDDAALKTNRLRLLNSVRGLYIKTADLSKLTVAE